MHKKKFFITEECPPAIIFQSLDSGYYDYSEFKNPADAWESSEKEQEWVKERIAETHHTLEDCKKEFLDSLTTATPENALEAAKLGYAWPIELGYVDELESI